MLEDKVEQVLGRKVREGLGVSRLEYFYRRGVHNLLWQFILVWDYSNVEGILATLAGTPLLANLESMNAEPRGVGRSKDGAPWKIEKAVGNFYIKRALVRV